MVLASIILSGFLQDNKMLYAQESMYFGMITIDNPNGDSLIQYDVAAELQKGDSVAFNIDFNSSEAVCVSIWADGLRKCYEKEYAVWKGKSTISFEADNDMQYFSIHVEYQGPDLNERSCTIDTVRLEKTDAEGEEAILLENEEEAADRSFAVGIEIYILLIAIIVIVIWCIFKFRMKKR